MVTVDNGRVIGCTVSHFVYMNRDDLTLHKAESSKMVSFNLLPHEHIIYADANQVIVYNQPRVGLSTMCIQLIIYNNIKQLDDNNVANIIRMSAPALALQSF